MELIVGLIALGALFAWGVMGWWRYWRAVQAAKDAPLIAKAQIESLQMQIYAYAVRDKHRRETETIDWDAIEQQRAQARRDAWAEAVLSEVEKGWTE